jgi:hypothetical protein
LELETLLYEIISAQAKVILGGDGLGDVTERNILSEELAAYEIRLAALHADKRALYERMVLGEIDAGVYQQGRNEIDGVIVRFQTSRDMLKARISCADSAGVEANAALAAAANAAEAGRLTRPLAKMLIDKVYI